MEKLASSSGYPLTTSKQTMAFSTFNNSKTVFSFFIILPLSSWMMNMVTNVHGAPFSEEISEGISLRRVEKTTHLHFYFHDILSGKNPTAVKIAEAEAGVGFGTTYMIDDLLTEGQERTSKLVGRAQGMYAVASQKQLPELLMVVNYEFSQAEYNGSSISILGRNPVMNDVREMPIVGGSGVFRLARGYALAHTVWFDPSTGDATVEYNAYVMHS